MQESSRIVTSLSLCWKSAVIDDGQTKAAKSAWLVRPFAIRTRGTFVWEHLFRVEGSVGYMSHEYYESVQKIPL